MKMKKIKLKQSKIFDLQRSVVAYATTTSWKNIPHVSYIYEPDITEFYKEFKVLSEERAKIGSKISFNTIMLKAIVTGLLAAPELNSFIEYSYHKGAGTTHICDEINLSIPWVLPDDKMIPLTIPVANKMSLSNISDYVATLTKKIEKTNLNELLYRAIAAETFRELKRLNLSTVKRVLASQFSGRKAKGLEGRERENYYKTPEDERLTEKDILGGTVTISNIGSLYKEQRGYFGMLEIIAPQVFVIGLGSIQEKPGIFKDENGNKQMGIQNILPMCLAFDHRAVDFINVVPFLKRMDEIFANPHVIHEW